MFNKSDKEKTIKTGKGKYKLLISAILACGVTAGLIAFEANMLSNYETIEALAVARGAGAIASGTVINENNASKYFELKEIPKDMQVENAVTGYEQLIGMQATEDMYENQIVLSSSFKNIDELLDGITDPVEVSVKAGDLSQIVGGILREGDLIDISVVNEEGKNESILNAVYVAKAFNSSGEKLEKNSETASTAMIVNIIISKADEQLLNEKIQNGIIRIAKTNDVIK